MRFRLLIICVMQFAMVQAIFAEAEADENCLKTAEDFNAKCSKFPKPFDTKLPLMLYLELFGKGAAIKIEADGSQLRYLAYINSPETPAYKTGNHIDKICFHPAKSGQPDRVDVFYQGSSIPKEVFPVNGKVKIEGRKFKRCDVAQFESTANNIKKVILEATEPKPDAGTN